MAQRRRNDPNNQISRHGKEMWNVLTHGDTEHTKEDLDGVHGDWLKNNLSMNYLEIFQTTNIMTCIFDNSLVIPTQSRKKEITKIKNLNYSVFYLESIHMSIHLGVPRELDWLLNEHRALYRQIYICQLQDMK